MVNIFRRVIFFPMFILEVFPDTSSKISTGHPEICSGIGLGSPLSFLQDYIQRISSDIHSENFTGKSKNIHAILLPVFPEIISLEIPAGFLIVVHTVVFSRNFFMNFFRNISSFFPTNLYRSFLGVSQKMLQDFNSRIFREISIELLYELF